MRKIVLFDFSKVVSEIGISRFLAEKLMSYIDLSKDEIFKKYKSFLPKILVSDIGIHDVVVEFMNYAKPSVTKAQIQKIFTTIPTVDKKLIKLILRLKHKYDIFLVSDTYKELGDEIRSKYTGVFDGFIFSYEINDKKSSLAFWKRIFTPNMIFFVDDKQENIDNAKSVGIDGMKYISFKENHQQLISLLFPIKKYIILGAGAAGMSFGYKLKNQGNSDFLILERNIHPFGLCKSWQLGKNYYDVGGHALHDSNKDIISFFNDLKVSFDRYARKAYIHYKDRYIPFPIQTHLAYLPPEEKEQVLQSIIEAQNKKKAIKSLYDFLHGSFGDLLCKFFLIPYNQKLWKISLKTIGINWSERIFKPDLKKILGGYNQKQELNDGPNSFVNYPTNGGFEAILDPIYNYVKEQICFGEHVESIDTDLHLVITNDNIYHYKNLISTIPLDQLLMYTGSDRHISLLKKLSLFLVTIVLKKKDIITQQRIYSADPKYYFHKCAINSNSNIAMTTNDEILFSFEISYYKKLSYPIEIYMENCKLFLKDNEFLQDNSQIIYTETKNIEYAYPIQTNEMISKKDILLSSFKKKNIYPLGRFGTWSYDNLDKVLRDSFLLYYQLEGKKS